MRFSGKLCRLLQLSRIPGSALFFTLWVVFPCAAAVPCDAKSPLTIADTIFRGGPVVTVNPDKAEVQALAIAGGKIIAVGDELTVMATCVKGKTTVIDLQGKTLMPGFVEPHTHAFMTAASDYLVTDLSSFAPEPATIQKTVEDLHVAVPGVPKGGWLSASGFDPSRTTPFMASLTAEILDGAQYTVTNNNVKAMVKIEDQVPIFVVNQSGHLAYVNSKAIQLAKITPDTPNPAGGVYERVGGGATGPLTGVLREVGAFRVFMELIAHSPSKNDFADANMLPALKHTYDDFARAGVTTATELTLGAVTGSIANELTLLDALARESATPVRMRAYIDHRTAALPGQFQVPPDNPASDMFAVLGVKFVADGSTQGLTAGLNAPYNYPVAPPTGLLNFTVDALYRAASPYMDQGWQIAIHSNGDRSTDDVLDVYERLALRARTAKRKSPAELRCRIDHLTVTEAGQLDRIKKLGLTASMTIGHVYFWGHAFADQKPLSILGSTRAARIDPAKSLLDLQVRFSFNSDSPVTPVAPLRYIATAVSREMQNGGALGANQAIGVDDAIRAVTLDAAYQLFLDKQIGSLEREKWADLVILEKNPRTTKAADIAQIKVLSTYLSGICKSGECLTVKSMPATSPPTP